MKSQKVQRVKPAFIPAARLHPTIHSSSCFYPKPQLSPLPRGSNVAVPLKTALLYWRRAKNHTAVRQGTATAQ